MNEEDRSTFALGADQDLMGSGIDWIGIGVEWAGLFMVALIAGGVAGVVSGRHIVKFQLQREHDIRDHPFLRELHSNLLEIRKRDNNLQVLKGLYSEKQKYDNSGSAPDRQKWRKESGWDLNIRVIAQLWSAVITPNMNKLKSKSHLAIKASLVKFGNSEFTDVPVLDAAIARIEGILIEEYGEDWKHL